MVVAARRRMRARAVRGGGYATLLGLPRKDPLETARDVEKGLPFSAVERFVFETGLTLAAVAGLARITPRTLHRRKEQGRLVPDESDRLLRAARVFAQALDLFEGDAASARAWLSAPQPALGGERPLALAGTDLGAREVEALIARLEHGVLP
jgi:putative toxin-antitoxin system antitoxin component (TIGR02293 family)